MKVLNTIERISVCLYVALVNIVHFERQRFAENRGQASLEYIAIAAGIVVVAGAAFFLFRTPITNCGHNIIENVFNAGSPDYKGNQCR
jgi:uncharacterized protein (UPF0333 family)